MTDKLVVERHTLITNLSIYIILPYMVGSFEDDYIQWSLLRQSAMW